jgi:Ner family transcriptional regulator
MTEPKTVWDQHSIKAALHRKGMTLTGLAELTRVNPNNFRAVWSRPNRKAEAAIADFLGVPVETLFPDRYPIKKARILSPEHQEAIRKAAA